MMVILKELIPLMRENDVRLVDSDGSEICLLRKDYIHDILSEKYLNMMVNSIYNEEEILDTVNICLNGDMED